MIPAYGHPGKLAIAQPAGTTRSSKPEWLRVGLLNRGDPAEDGSSRVRAFQFVPHLQSHGIHVRSLTWDVRSRASVLAYSARAARMAGKCDVLWLQKPCQHPGLLRLLARLNPRLVVDFDDAVWAPTSSPGGSSSTPVSKTYGRRLVSALRLARIVTPGNRYLAHFARRAARGACVQLLPSVVDLGRHPPSPARPFRSPIHVGWLGSTGNHRDFIDAVCTALGELTARGTIRVRVMSGQRPNLAFPFDFVPWSLDGEVPFLETIDVGIMPLPGTPRALGRCGYKALLYMAAGLPVVASPIGAALEVIEAGVSGLLAGDPQDWIAALQSLADDPERRRALGAAGRRLVEAGYSIDSALPTLVQVLRDAAEAPRVLVTH